ncbi:type III-A CRISPR-associated protein Cas10/Csm1 [Calothrix sp. HK-06]|nr:type III-A CRISPR-associated protein Cas10/Csm1 [Calothrix sp. HK-06]
MDNQKAPPLAALQVIQTAITVLAGFAGVDLSGRFTVSLDDAASKALAMLWEDTQPGVLRLLFDSVNLSKTLKQEHYWHPQFIASESPVVSYPQKNHPVKSDFDALKQSIFTTLNNLDDSDWGNLSLLMLILEKYGSFISYGADNVALFDIAKSTAAVAAALTSNTSEFSLVAGDLSGIQDFIYTISSDGALKSLRARSFYLELVTEEVVQQLLLKLNLPRCNVIYAGGGNLYILAPGINGIGKQVEELRAQFNIWLEKAFQGKVFLALDCLNFNKEDIKTTKFADYWSEIIAQKLAKQKARKFSNQIYDFIKQRPSHEPCRVCHRDDVKPDKLQPLNEPDSALACGTCRRMYRLGAQLLRVDAIVRSTERDYIPKSGVEKLILRLPKQTVYYHLFANKDDLGDIQDSETVFLVNNWEVEQYRHSNCVLMLLGNYAASSQEEVGSTMRANEMVEKAKGIPRVGYLRMDVDRLGRIFAEGLGSQKTLPRIAGLSRQMSYFFKVYLNSLAADRTNNVPQEIKQLTPLDKRLNLVFIYAGGDDLFVSGAWNQVVEFAFDVYQCFRIYTGYNSDVTLSGGISISDIKFPLYQAASESGEAEEKAKGNGKDSLGLFGQVFKWNEWLGIESDIDTEAITYLAPLGKPNLLGVLPFVERLTSQNIGINYSRNFVRNLLTTAQVQEEALKKFEDKKSSEAMGTRYYLHLPKIAYTLTRLPKDALQDVDFRTSLKSPYNAPYFRAIATWIELLNR